MALTKSKVDDTKVVEAFLYLNFSNNRSKQSAKTITFTDLIKVTEMIEKQCNVLDLSLTWQEAEERHEDHCQEAEGGDPGESLLASHRAHLGVICYRYSLHNILGRGLLNMNIMKM